MSACRCVLRFGAVAVGLLLIMSACGVCDEDVPTTDTAIKELSSRYYDLKAAGARDLICTVTSPTVNEIVRQTTNNPDATVAIKFMWKAPGNYRFNVQGLPNGPTELRQNIAQLFGGLGSHVVRKSLADLIRESEAQITTDGDFYKITGTVTGTTEDIDRFEAFVKPEGWVIDRIVTYGKTGGKATLTYEIEETGGMRLVTREKSTAEQPDGKTSETEVTYQYAPVDGVWTVRTAAIRAKTPDGKSAQIDLAFGNYQVNIAGMVEEMLKADATTPATGG